MKFSTPKKFLIASLLFAVLLITLYSLVTGLTFAFNPPTGPGGIGGGAIGVDVYNNLAIGTSTSGLDSKVLIYATSTNTFFLKVLNPTASPIFVIKNDGRVGIATSTPTSTLTVQGDLTVTGIIYGIFNGQLSGSVSAANVSNGVFGSLVGGGNYSFPSSLGVATSSQIGLPQALSVYGGAYVSGNVGIGTSSPVYRLDVGTGDLNVQSGVYRQGGTNIGISRTCAVGETVASTTVSGGIITRGSCVSLSSGITVLAANVASGTFGANVGGGNYSFLGTSNVGIGTISPQYKLDVSGGVRVTDLRIATTSAQTGYVWKATDTQGNGTWQIDATGLTGGQTNYVPYWTSPTTQGTSSIYYVSSTQRVGIGTTSPLESLHVGGLGDIRADDEFKVASGALGDKGYTFVADENTAMFSPAANTIAFGTAGVERLRINPSGYVGIGITDPQSKLHVVGDIQLGPYSLGNNRISIQNSAWFLFSTFGGSRFILDNNNFVGGADTDDFSIYAVNTSGTPLFRIQGAGSSVGNVGVGSMSPGSKLTVAEGDVFVASSSRGIILKNGTTCARAQLNSTSDGFTFTIVTCPTF